MNKQHTFPFGLRYAQQAETLSHLRQTEIQAIATHSNTRQPELGGFNKLLRITAQNWGL
jgi:hypothetical protein